MCRTHLDEGPRTNLCSHGLAVPLSIKEAAGILNVSEKTMRQLCREGKIEARKIGREWRIPRRAVLSLCEEAA